MLATGASAGIAIAPAAAQSVPAPTTSMEVATGSGRLINVDAPMAEVFVADQSIADVHISSSRQLYVFGKSQGETTVYATGNNGRVVYSATVRVGNNIDSIASMLSLAMPEASITATPMNGLILLTGTVKSPDDVAEAERLVQAFVGDEVKIISRLRTAVPLQVNLQVRFAEVSRSFVKNIGVNLASVDSSSGFKFGVGQGRDFYEQYSPGGPVGVGTDGTTGTTVVTNPATGTALYGAGRVLGLDLLGSLDLGETIGQVTTLANPNLTSLSGETANFLAGGEIPIPIAQGLGAVSVEYKQYGVSLSFTPTVLSDGRISLRVRPEVSQLSSAGAVQFQGTTIPAITTRRVETTVELGSGESFMIAGLLSNTHQNSIDKAPGIGDLPVLGALFRSNDFQRSETELVVVITPYLVKPVNGSDIRLPTDGYRAPNDFQRVFGGQLSGSAEGEPRPRPMMAPPQQGAAPAIGSAQPVPNQPAASPEPEARQNDDRRGSGDAAPGFSLN
ncbi:type II and III secretion system protein family protein [Sphingosinithalassobacter tenebrarum]|uniref:Type II and III secretion system protein family protein n=2 Tax=Stakelama tenebrarum TaxID=2711215 RepID=A0A6G6YA45_9SPHN|nr:type II and III secretion system protein family protein [Sphingosinithalassobacter tenebrarum]QIG81789.1 type II and III secretion system protein family protein [Sphingosinithalassobacter tenebrarum]